MSATQARKLMEGYRKTMVENELKKIKNKIEEAVNKGEDSLCLYGSIGKDARAILENLGYNVHSQQYRNEVETTIKW